MRRRSPFSQRGSCRLRRRSGARRPGRGAGWPRSGRKPPECNPGLIRSPGGFAGVAVPAPERSCRLFGLPGPPSSVAGAAVRFSLRLPRRRREQRQLLFAQNSNSLILVVAWFFDYFVAAAAAASS
ncbi:hypothetical protein Syun_028388 [Stephania yunnanensis]|uniref:Uncharacterized protein n=1 Tax=Stephania yunnanensis TaxID=152371 RepID=A0AAP0HQT1_9MAGN